MEIFTFTSIVVAIIAYLLGSINTGLLIGKKLGVDIRSQGSKSSGATNALRILGKRAGVITLLGDILKGAIAMGIAVLIAKITKSDIILLKEVAGICVILGHIFPLYYGFKGGKGVATSLAVILCTNLEIGAICLVFALIIMGITRMVSLGSILAAVLFPILTLFLAREYFFPYSIIIAALVLIKHRENIKRLLKGQENKLGQKKTLN